MLTLASIALGLAVASDGANAVRVTAAASGFAVMALGAPLSVVLEEIGRHSGVKVTYEGAAPSALLTCDFRAASAAEAFLRALEGHGLNYALYGGTAGAPGILIISAPSSAAVSRTAMATRNPEPSGEVAAVMDSPDEEALPLVAPPPGGAIPPRFMRQGEEPPSQVAEDDSRPSGESGMNALERPSQAPSPMRDERRAARQERMGQGGPRSGPGSPHN